MTATVIDIGTLIISSPETCGNRPRIAGTRITVGRIATLWKQGLNAEAIQNENLCRPSLLSCQSRRN